jgi:hypothetical protein
LEKSFSFQNNDEQTFIWFYFHFFFILFICLLDIPLGLVEGSDKSLFDLTPDSINFNTGGKWVSVFLDPKIEKVCVLIFICL